MDTRKDYVPPAIVAEDVFEQTSLACNATMPYPEIDATCFAGNFQINFALGLLCLNNVQKGGAFALEACDTNLGGPEEVVALS